MPDTLEVTQQETIPEFVVTNEEAVNIISSSVKLAVSERLDVRRVTDLCFRVNIWTEVHNPKCSVADNIIIRSYFVTIRPDEVIIN